MLCRSNLLLSTLAMIFMCFSNAAAQDEEPAAGGIVASEPDEHGLVTKMRPILPKIAVGDPLRFALHFDGKDGPINHGDEKLGHQMLDRTATLNTIEVAVQPPGGKWQVLQTGDKAENPRKQMLYSNPTFLLQLSGDGLKSLYENGQEELTLPWKWDHKITPGEYGIAVRGTLKLSTPARKVKQGGKIEEFPPTETEVAFRSKPINIEVVREDMTFQKLEELQAEAVKALEKHVAAGTEKLKIVAAESIPIADEKGNRVIRVRANMPPPAPPAGGGGIIAIAGGQGYWQYEVVMTPAGKPVSFNRARKGFCVARGTTIETPQGPRSVEQLRSGDVVWAIHAETLSLVRTTVHAVFQDYAEETIRINGRLQLTGNHPMFVSQNGGKFAWKPAGEVRLGDRLIDRDGTPATVDSIGQVPGRVDVFDVSVAGPNNFLAGGLLVHNKSIAWTPQAFVPWYSLWNRAPAEKKR